MSLLQVLVQFIVLLSFGLGTIACKENGAAKGFKSSDQLAFDKRNEKNPEVKTELNEKEEEDVKLMLQEQKTLIEKIELAKNSATSAQVKIEQMEKEIKNLKAQLDVDSNGVAEVTPLVEQVNALRAEVNLLTQEQNDVNQSLADNQKKYEDIINALIEKTNSLPDDNEVKKMVKEELETSILAFNKELEKVADLIAESKVKVAELEATTDPANEELLALQENIRKLEEKKEVLEDTVSKYECALSGPECSAVKGQTAAPVQENNETNLSDDRSEQEEPVQNRNTEEIIELTSRIGEIKAEVKSHEDLLKRINTEMKDLDIKIEKRSFSSQNYTELQQIASGTHELQRLKKENLRIKSEILVKLESMKIQIQDLEKDLADLGTDFESQTAIKLKI